MLFMNSSGADKAAAVSATRGSQNVHVIKICCGFFRIGFRSSDRREYSGFLLCSVTSLTVEGHRLSWPDIFASGGRTQPTLCRTVTIAACLDLRKQAVHIRRSCFEEVVKTLTIRRHLLVGIRCKCVCTTVIYLLFSLSLPSCNFVTKQYSSSWKWKRILLLSSSKLNAKLQSN